MSKTDDIFDFGFTTVEPKDIERAEDVKNRLDRVIDLIEPFLDNLAKDPQKDIHWPDRDKKIKEFKKRLIDIAYSDK